MRVLAASALALLAMLAGPACAGLFEKEAVFTEAEVQAALDRRGPLERSYGSIVALALPSAPRISLERDDGRAGIEARIELRLAGNRPLPVDLVASTGVRYDDNAKAFFLAGPTVESLLAPGLPKELEPTVRQSAGRLLASYFRTNPVYVLRADGSPEERAAHWFLKSVRIERGRVFAVLAPF